MGNFAMAFIFCGGCCWFSAKITWWWTWVQTFPIRIEMSIPSSIGFRIYLVCIVILASLRNSRFFISLQQVFTMFQMRFHRISIVFFCISILDICFGNLFANLAAAAWPHVFAELLINLPISGNLCLPMWFRHFYNFWIVRLLFLVLFLLP